MSPRVPFEPGHVVEGRFQIEAIAGAGGASTVYRAWDREARRRVALKVVALQVEDARLTREVALSSAVRHPGIVRCLDHGRLAGVGPYLVLEWVDGESLAARLARGRLSIAESIAVGRSLAEALRELHDHGVVHRDLKPSNVLCDRGDVGRARIVDLGIALRPSSDDTRVTEPGLVVGSCAYMAPERVTGGDGGPAVDVFSLGCVLFECLTGRRAYDGADDEAILAKVAWQDAPRVGDLAEVPRALDALVARMMSRDPTARPDAGAVARTLGELVHAVPEPPPRDINGALERLFGVGFDGEPLDDAADDGEDAAPGSEAAVTLRRAVPALGEGEQRLLWIVATSAGPRGGLEASVPLVASFGARWFVLANGTAVAVVQPSGAVRDDATRAARCARALARELAGSRVALGAGRAVVGEHLAGEAVDRAVAALERCTPDHVRIDELSASLLGGTFAIRRDEAGPYLGPELPASRRTRTLLGRATPFVGRETEIAHLEVTLRESVEGVARAVLVVAAPGMGKSRLRYELVARAATIAPNARLWLGRGDEMRSSSSFGVMTSLLSDAFTLQDGEPLDTWRSRIAERVAARVDAAIAPRVSAFLSELCGAPLPDPPPELASARRDARALGDQIRRAFGDWLAAETAVAPVVLVLEDLHWADVPSIECVGAALRELRERPLLVLALSRAGPEERVATAFRGITMTELRVPGLPRRAAGRLVRATLGDDASDATVDRIVERAVGNVLFLEELIRAEAEGRGESLPDTVLAMALARLDSLDARARRVLRACSILGRSFRAADVSPLLGDETEADVCRWLEHLADREFLTLSRAAPGADARYVFRHALMREASYASLTPPDRELGHRIAGASLARQPAADPSVVAEHLERGGELAAAVGWYERSAERALGGNDLASTLAHAGAAMRCGADGDVASRLSLLAAVAHEWLGEYRSSLRSAQAAAASLRPGSDAWFDAVGQLVTVAGRLGDTAQLESAAASLEAFAASPSPTASHRIAVARLALRAFYADRPDLARKAIAWLDARGRHADPSCAAWELRAREVLAALERDDAGELEAGRAAAASFDAAGDLRSAGLQRGNVGFLLMRLGDNEGAESQLESALAIARRIGAAPMEALALSNLGMVLARTDRLEEGIAVERRAIEMFARQGDRRMECGARLYLAWMLVRAGAFAEAEAEARLALGLGDAPFLEIMCRGVLGWVYVEQGRAQRALAAVLRGVELADSEPGNDGEALVRLVHAEALFGSGDKPAATEAILAARSRLLERARTIRDPDLARSFLRGVPENARTLERANEWAGVTTDLDG